MTITLQVPTGNPFPVPQARPITNHGFYVDANSYDAGTLAEMFDETAAHGLTSIMFANGDTDKLDTLLTVCDSYGVRAACGPRTEIDAILWNPDDIPLLSTVQTALEPMLETLAAHQSLAMWYPLDEPGLNDPGNPVPNQRDLMDRAALLCEAYRNIAAVFPAGHVDRYGDPDDGQLIPIVPLFIGLDRIEAGVAACLPDKLSIDVYPYGMIDSGGGVPAPADEFDMTMRPFGYDFSAQSYIDQALAFVDPDMELILTMQAHNFFGPPADESIWELWGNRKPTVGEMQQQHDLAASFKFADDSVRCKELYWFRWESNPNPEDGAMVGLDDDPILLAAVIAISQGDDVNDTILAAGNLTMPMISVAANATVGDVDSSDGVPEPTIPFNSGSNAVINFWDAHVLNPIVYSPQTQIESPPVRYTLTSGQSIQTAYNNIVSNYPDGGTIILGDGSYSGLPDIFGYQLTDRGHIHIKAANRRMVTVQIPTRPIVAAHPWVTRYHDHESDYPGWDFSVGISSGVSQNLTENGVNARDLVTTNRIHDVYFYGIIFDAQGEDRRFDLMGASGIMFDDCSFINGVGSLDGHVHTGPICGRVCIDHVYYRDCDFAGTWKQGTYLDGVHGFATVNCRNVGDIRNELWLLLCNDDFTRDYNENGTYQDSEFRKAQFVIVHGGDTGGIAYPLQVTGSEIMMTDIALPTAVNTAIWWETKATWRSTRQVPVFEEFRNAIIRNVTIPNGAVRCLIHAQNSDFHPTESEVDPSVNSFRYEPEMFGYQIINVQANYDNDIEIQGNFG